MEPEIIKKDELKIAGCVSYGGNIHELWQIFMKNEKNIKHVNQDAGYEIHIYPDLEMNSEKYHIMVGIEVDKFEDLPLETFAKIIPACTYAVFTHRLANGGYEGINKEMDKWLNESNYKLAFPMSIQYYDERFKGGNDPDSEIDFYLPITFK
ncbi:MAG: GyrI-like domain-containing protein [Spirochaetales bacterium]|nr:GyrI-like domain-containing protein [Spirochaetales bacterium]